MVHSLPSFLRVFCLNEALLWVLQMLWWVTYFDNCERNQKIRALKWIFSLLHLGNNINMEKQLDHGKLFLAIRVVFGIIYKGKVNTYIRNVDWALCFSSFLVYVYILVYSCNPNHLSLAYLVPAEALGAGACSGAEPNSIVPVPPGASLMCHTAPGMKKLILLHIQGIACSLRGSCQNLGCHFHASGVCSSLQVWMQKVIHEVSNLQTVLKSACLNEPLPNQESTWGL